MLKVTMELNMVDVENDYCSPVIVVSEDNTDETCPIVLPEYILRVVAVTVKEELEKSIVQNYKTVKEVIEALYGE